MNNSDAITEEQKTQFLALVSACYHNKVALVYTTRKSDNKDAVIVCVSMDTNDNGTRMMPIAVLLTPEEIMDVYNRPLDDPPIDLGVKP